jgi:fructose-1,6-bisphosphatase/inositol monophosphatase family enzyme
MQELDLIQKFEPVFIEAANLAASLKQSAVANQKLSSGVADIDIVTNADMEVQEFILKKLAESSLSKCEIVAEENTPSKGLFSKDSNLVITLDPIDGTMLYTQGKTTYSLIVTLHDKKRPLYTFDYYPELNWGIKILNDKYEFIGNLPKFENFRFPKAITYSAYGSNNPEKNIPELFREFTQKGYTFVDKKSLNTGVGATGQFILGIVDGIYMENGSAVDCLAGLHFAIANNFEIYQDIDIIKPVTSEKGNEEYSGYYLAIRR